MLNAATPSTPPIWRRYLAYGTVALMPLSWNVERLVQAKEVTYRSPLDFLLPLLAVLMIADLIRGREWARHRFPPLAAMLWAALAGASLFWSESFPLSDALFPSPEGWRTWARGAMNPVFYGVAGAWVFQNLAREAAEYRRLALALGASCAVCVLLALKQYVGPVGLPFDPENPARDLGGVSNIRLGGWYEYRGMFGAQMALLVPAAAAFALLDRDAAVRWAAGALAVVALCVTLSAGGFLGACAGIAAVAVAFAASRNWLTGLTALVVLLAVVAVILPRLPRNNTAVVFRGIALYAVDSDDGKTKATARLRRDQAMLDLLAAPRNPHSEHSAAYWLTGVGTGRYQKEINRFYQPAYPKPGRRTDDEAAYDMESDERFTFGFFDTVAVELGLPGLAVMLFLFGTWICAAHGAFARLSFPAVPSPSREDGEHTTAAMLALAAFGAGCGALVLSVFASSVIRGVGGSFAFFFALALCAQRWANEAADAVRGQGRL